MRVARKLTQPQPSSSTASSVHPILAHGIDIAGRADKLELITPRVKLESYYQTLVEGLLKTGHHHVRGVGFTDVTLDNAHVEIKNARRYHETPGQLLKYALADPRPYYVVILFGQHTVTLDFLAEFFSHTIVTNALWFDEHDNLHTIYRSTGTTSPYFER